MNFLNLNPPVLKHEGAPEQQQQQQDAQQQAPQFLPHPQGAPVWHMHPQPVGWVQQGTAPVPGAPQQWQQQQQGPYAVQPLQYQQPPAQAAPWVQQAGPGAGLPPYPQAHWDWQQLPQHLQQQQPLLQQPPQQQPLPPPLQQQQAWQFAAQGAQGAPGMGLAPPPQLGYEQQRALELVQEGYCVFLTGEGSFRQQAAATA